jgi:ankyrin repeat protein
MARPTLTHNKTIMKGAFLLILFTLTSLTTFAHKEKWDDNKKDWSPLMLAIYNGQVDKVNKLIEQNVDVNFITPGTNSNWRLTALEVAIRKDNDVAVEALLSTNKISKPETYLMTACGQKSAKTVQLLIKYGSKPNDTLENGYSVAMMAASFGSLEILECLVKNGANLKQTRKVDGMTILMFAAFNGDVKKVKLLLDNGAEKHIKDKSGKVALDYVDQIYEHLKVSETTKAELRQFLK